ncbi:hypothetical protein CAL14_05605 [Bordetella genomosp. 9]|uniref:hypothetical protein n=1 Tax=Bordetella genomosp. 9 TaxID=1416803 RepID=UPI000A29057E|nr:hypothetical protein [Bordetella genomosp. 9]ARP89830.1 hypothetical protein CAL14_05605 [Bordetella genomosp. 9]
MTKLPYVGVLILLAGCASKPIDSATLARAQAPIVCGDKQQCDKYWQAAQSWVATHSGFKIQLASDSVIQTYGPRMYDYTLAYTVVKEPGQYGTYTLKVSAVCGMPGNCRAEAIEKLADLKDYLLTQ